VKKYGADVVRLWVASADYRNDIVVSEERINKVSETYRLIRNTIRYQLSNLYDFDPAKHKIADESLTGLDRWILGEFADLEAAVAAAYERYEFHAVYQRVSQFAAVELSAIYHDIVKDRLYTDPANSHRRRSTQTALWTIATRLCQMLAPMLAFTADEAWEFIPGHSTGASVHASDWQPTAFPRSDAEKKLWTDLFALRQQVLPELEKARQAKAIGKALEAKVKIGMRDGVSTWVAEHVGTLKELLNVSQIQTAHLPGEADKTDANGWPRIEIARAEGQKCERCWHYEADVGQNSGHPTLCSRCVTAVG
jgi:isoleucyl-tRNA synthetase